jgi:hypothetical protein
MALVDEQRPIDARIAGHILQSIPAHWEAADARITRNKIATSSESYSITIESPNNQKGIAVPTEELEASIRDLFLLHDAHSTGLRAVTYKNRKTSGKWRVTCEFEYEA